MERETGGCPGLCGLHQPLLRAVCQQGKGCFRSVVSEDKGVSDREAPTICGLCSLFHELFVVCFIFALVGRRVLSEEESFGVARSAPQLGSRLMMWAARGIDLVTQRVAWKDVHVFFFLLRGGAFV